MEADLYQQPNEYQVARSAAFSHGQGVNVWYALGLNLDVQGAISDVRIRTPADAAKLAHGEKILAVTGASGGEREDSVPPDHREWAIDDRSPR